MDKYEQITALLNMKQGLKNLADVFEDDVDSSQTLAFVEQMVLDEIENLKNH